MRAAQAFIRPTLWQTFRVCQSFILRCEPHRLLCAPHFGKLSEFAKVLSFGASRTGFYAPHTLANFQSLPKFYPSVRAAQAFMRPTLWQTFRVCQSFILRCEPHRLLSFAHPSLILRSSFAYPSLILRHILGCASSPTFLRSRFAGSVSL